MSRELPSIFMERLERLERELSQHDFCVLVWGSGQHHTEEYAKRLQFKDYLEQRLGVDRVFLSEDDLFQRIVDRYGLAVAEALEAAAIDAVVVLDTSVGPHVEIGKYADILAEKAIVFVAKDSPHLGGFARVAFDSLKVEFYSPQQYDDCKELRQKANEFVQALSFGKCLVRS